jgi:hypothetical protein
MDPATEVIPTETPEGDDAPLDATALQAKLAEKDAEIARRDSALIEANKNVEAARTYVQGVAAQLQAAAAQPKQVEQPSDDRDFAERFSDDPEAALDKMFQERVRPVYQEYARNTAIQNRETLRRDIGEEDWKEFGADIDAVMAGYDDTVKARPDAYKVAYDIIRGRNVEKIADKKLNEKIEREKKAQTEGASPPGTKKAAPDSLNDAEKQVAKKFGLSEKEYIASKKEHEEQGGFWRPKSRS